MPFWTQGKKSVSLPGVAEVGNRPKMGLAGLLRPAYVDKAELALL